MSRTPKPENAGEPVEPVPTSPLARKAAITGIVLLVLGLGSAPFVGGSNTLDAIIGFFIFMAPVCALVAVVAQSRVKEAARIDALPEGQRLEEKRAAKIKPVITTILLATIFIGGTTGKLIVACGGIVVLVAWIRLLGEPDAPV